MFPLCYICFTKIVQFEKRNSGDVQLIFIFTYKYNERRVEKKELALFFYRATSHFRISHKNSETRPNTDGFRKNNVNYWVFREIRSIIPHL